MIDLTKNYKQNHRFFNKESDLNIENPHRTYFNEYGILTSDLYANIEMPKMDIIARTNIIVINNSEYDLSNAKSIEEIPIPKFKKPSSQQEVNLFIDKILIKRIGTYDNDSANIALAFKTFDLMRHSPLEWTAYSYFNIVTPLLCDGLFESADKLYKKIYEIDIEQRKNNFVPFYERKENKPDYDDEEYVALLLEEYSPEDVENLKNAPSVDLKIPTPENYEKGKLLYIAKLKKLSDYKLIKDVLKDDGPKNYQGYCRMRSMKTKNYFKMLDKVRALGYEIDE